MPKKGNEACYILVDNFNGSVINENCFPYDEGYHDYGEEFPTLHTKKQIEEFLQQLIEPEEEGEKLDIHDVKLYKIVEVPFVVPEVKIQFGDDEGEENG